MNPQAITFDFYMTLVSPKGGIGRAGMYQEFLKRNDLKADPWEHQVLYDVFEYYAEAYDTEDSPAAKKAFWVEFTKRLLKRTGVDGDHDSLSAKHALEICDILGPNHFEIYPDVIPTLTKLKEKGIQIAVLSNWQKGLEKFCIELGICDYFTHIIASAEVGSQKPDPAIFAEAGKRLGVELSGILHVGDSPIDDIQGGKAAGVNSVLIDRTVETMTSTKVINDLRRVNELIGNCI